MTYSTKPGTPEELLHYGIRGMKWGVRKGGIGARYKGGLSDKNQQTTAILTRMRENRSKGLDEHLGRAISRSTHLTKKGFNKSLDKKLGKLEQQRKRIESGKLKTRDVLEAVGSVGVVDLLVSRRDNRG